MWFRYSRYSACTRYIHHNRHSHFKKLEPQKITQNIDLKGRTAIICEADEQWFFVQNKSQQHWLWYAVDSVTRKVIAHVFGPRTDATLRRLLGLLFTQRIERHNLNLRTHIKRRARRTICFSKSFELHEKVIGHYLEIHHYNRCVT